MTPAQKFIADKLLEGYYIVPATPKWYRLRSPQHHPVRKLSQVTFTSFLPILRKNKNIYLLNKNEVRRLHGNNWLKKKYKRGE